MKGETAVAIIDVYNKDRDVTYVYDSTSYWDKDLKQPRSKRKLIGKRDPETNEIVPTDSRRNNKNRPSRSRKSHSDTEYKSMYEQSLSVIQEKDAVIFELKQQLVSAQREALTYLDIIRRAEALFNKVTQEKGGRFQ